jgi:hypothetical protein
MRLSAKEWGKNANSLFVGYVSTGVSKKPSSLVHLEFVRTLVCVSCDRYIVYCCDVRKEMI